MLQALLASGALFQGMKAEATAKMQRMAVMAACAVVALIFFFIALMAFAVAAYIALVPHVGAVGAACIVGGVSTLIGAIILFVGTRERSPRIAAASAAPAANPLEEAIPNVSEAVAKQPVPWMIGALALGMFLARRR